MFRITIGALLLSIIAAAGESQAEANAELETARATWGEAKAIAQKLRAAMSAGGGEYVKLLDQQAALYEKAEQAFRSSIRKNPENPHALADFGFFWIDRKQPANARSMFTAALRQYWTEQEKSKAEKKPIPAELALAPQREALIRRSLGGLLERSGDSAMALLNYKEAFNLDPADSRNRLSLAIGYCAVGQPHEAASLLKPWTDEKAEGVRDRPDKDPATMALGLYTLGYADEETGFLEDALQFYRKALTIAEKIEADDNAGVAERARMAIARLEDTFDISAARAKERAAENEERAKKNQPPLPDERESFAKAARMCDLGLNYKEQALDDADFRKLLTQCRVHNFAPADLDALGKHPQFDLFLRAMTEFQKAIVAHPKVARPYFELASCSVMLGRYGAARKMLDESALFSPNNLSILNLQGEVLLQLGQWEDAARAFAKILVLEPESGRANFGLARALAALQSDARQCQAGLDALDRAEQLGIREPPPDPKDPDRQPTVREQLTAALQRFERGEKAPPRPVVRGTNTQPRPERAMPEIWKGGLIDK